MSVASRDVLMKNLGKRLKQARESRGITQDELVERMGYKDRTAISEYENGKRRIYAHELPNLAEALETPIISLFGDSLSVDDDQEAYLLEWFRRIPDDRKQRAFTVLEQVKPLIIGGKE